MESLPTDILVYELSSWMFPYERLKLCGVSTTLHSIFNLATFKLQPSHLAYDAHFYATHLAPLLHDGILDVPHNILSSLSVAQLRHLKYLVICHRLLFTKYKALPKSSDSDTDTAPSPLLSALQTIDTLNFQNSASAFAVQPYATTFLCDLLRCGFAVTENDTEFQTETVELSKNSTASKNLSLNLSSNNLCSAQLSRMCRALLSRPRSSPLSLTQLDLSQNHNISDRSTRALLSCVGRHCPMLQSIDLSFANITDASCDAIAAFYDKYAYGVAGPRGCQLHRIDLSFTRISDCGLVTLDALFDELAFEHCEVEESAAHSDSESESKSSAETTATTETTESASSFEIVLEGCYFKEMMCRNYTRPKLQTTARTSLKQGVGADVRTE